MQKDRMDCLDGLRGFAAISVVVFHLMSALFPAAVPEQQANAKWIAYTPIAVLWNGTFAVAIFFVLSGFVLTNATLRKSDPLWIDIIIRYLRLAVPATLSTLFGWAMLKCFPDEALKLHEITRSRWLQWTHQNEIPDLYVALYSGAVDIFLVGGSYFNNVLWTMRPELIGSLICFFVCILSDRRMRIGAALALSLIIIFSGRYEYGCFTLGILLREAWISGRLPRRLAIPALLIGLMVGSLSGDAANVLGLGWLPKFLAVGTKNSVLYPLAAGLIVYGCINSEATVRLLSSKAGKFLGSISFPLYLLHVPFIYTLFAYAYLHVHESRLFTVFLIIGFFVTLFIFSYAAEIFIERPFLKLLGKLRSLLKDLNPSSSAL